MKSIRKIFGNKKGATAIEYGLIAALIAVAAIGAMGALGDQLEETFICIENGQFFIKGISDHPVWHVMQQGGKEGAFLFN